MTVKKARTNQGGSVVSFLVVGLVLVVLVGGGIYLLQHRTNNDATKIAKTSTSPSVSVQPTVSVAPAPPKPSTPLPVKPASPSPTTAPAPTSANMPVTGPSDLMPGGLTAALIIGSGVAFAQSRRARRHLLNQ